MQMYYSIQTGVPCRQHCELLSYFQLCFVEEHMIELWWFSAASLDSLCSSVSVLLLNQYNSLQCFLNYTEWICTLNHIDFTF